MQRPFLQFKMRIPNFQHILVISMVIFGFTSLGLLVECCNSNTHHRTCIDLIKESLLELGDTRLNFRFSEEHSNIKSVSWTQFHGPSHACQEIDKALISGEITMQPPSIICHLYSKCHCKGVRHTLQLNQTSFEPTQDSPVRSFKCYPTNIDIDKIGC